MVQILQYWLGEGSPLLRGARLLLLHKGLHGGAALLPTASESTLRPMHCGCDVEWESDSVSVKCRMCFLWSVMLLRFEALQLSTAKTANPFVDGPSVSTELPPHQPYRKMRAADAATCKPHIYFCVRQQTKWTVLLSAAPTIARVSSSPLRYLGTGRAKCFSTPPPKKRSQNPSDWWEHYEK